MLKGMLKEFKEFALRGNVIDLAVGVIIGAAFGKIVSSAVSDLIMPPIGMLVGKMDFSNLYLNLQDFADTERSLQAVRDAKVPVVAYGLFLNNLIDFTIIAFVIFITIKQINRLKKAPPPAAPDKKDCPRCFSSIPLKASRCPHCTSELEPAKA